MLPVDGINTSAPTQDTDENLAIAHQAESAAAKFLFDLGFISIVSFGPVGNVL